MRVDRGMSNEEFLGMDAPRTPWASMSQQQLKQEIQNRYSQSVRARMELAAMRKADELWVGYRQPTRFRRVWWAISSYFSNLWSAICGRRYED